MAISERDLNLNMVFTTAIEGGINYWAKVVDYEWSAKGEEIAEFFAEIREYDEESEKIRLISRHTISRGITRAYQYARENVDKFDLYQRRAITDLKYGRWDDVDYDAITADIVVQFGLFGELVYG